MTTRVLILHYTPPGVIGGVEEVIQMHVQLFESRGFQVQVVAGREGTATSGSTLTVIPEIDAASSRSAQIEDQLRGDVVSEEFWAQRSAIADKLIPLAEASDVLIAHNAFTLHFSLPLTDVLWEIARKRETGSVIAWCHDLTWTNPLYIPSAHDDFPWNLLRMRAPNAQYVTVSQERKDELAGLWGEGGDAILVVPNGVDPRQFLRLNDKSAKIAADYQLFDRDLVLVLPVRITRRKNIQLAIRAVSCLRDQGQDVRFLISGPLAPHHPGRSRNYLTELKALRTELDVEREVVFLADELGENPDQETVSCLYSIADALLFPSAQEGFGLPILEAGLSRAPVVASDIPIFREVGSEDIVRFQLTDSPDTIAASVRQAVDHGPSRLYRRVLREYRWDAIMDRQIIPLITRQSPGQVGASSRTEGEGS